MFNPSQIWIYWRDHYTNKHIESPFHGVRDGEEKSLCGLLSIKRGAIWDGGYYNLADGESKIHCKKCLRIIEKLKAQ